MKILISNKVLKFVFLVAIFLIIISCQSKSDTQYILKIDTLKVGLKEFQSRFNFNPYLKNFCFNDAKVIVLKSLFAEKILHLEYITRNMNNDSMNQDLIFQHLLEASIEQLRLDSVENIISISKDEIQEAYEISLNKIDVKYIVFNSKDEAEYYKNKIDDELTFESVASQYLKTINWINKPIPSKTIHWSMNQNKLESEIFNLELNEVSEPIFAFGEYYIIKVKNIHRSPLIEPDKIMKRRNLIKEQIKKQKVSKRYEAFFNKYIKKNLGVIDWVGIKKLFELVSESYDFDVLESNHKSYESKNPLDQMENFDFRNQPLIKFPNNTYLTAEDVLQKLKIGPYTFNFRSLNNFRNSFIHNINLLNEHYTLYQYAKKLDYHNNPEVKNEFEMWKSYYNAKSYVTLILDEIIKENSINTFPNNENFTRQNQILTLRSKKIDSVLATAVNKYNICINKKLYDEIELNKTDMVVRKSHFENRLIAPPLLPINGLLKWDRVMSKLLRENKIL